MISVGLARELRQAGVRWEPRAGDRFVVDQAEMTELVLWVSDFTVDLHTFGDDKILGFNGTTEWALDSVAVADCVWLPREDQLRELLGSMLVRLEHGPDGEWSVTSRVAGAEHTTQDTDVEHAYARSLLAALG